MRVLGTDVSRKMSMKFADSFASRPDALFGNQQAFNQTVFDTTTRFWSKETLTAEMLANSKVFRQVESRAANPNYTFTSSVENFSRGELAAPILVFGDIPAATVPRDMVLYFFGKFSNFSIIDLDWRVRKQKTSVFQPSWDGPSKLARWTWRISSVCRQLLQILRLWLLLEDRLNPTNVQSWFETYTPVLALSDGTLFKRW